MFGGGGGATGGGKGGEGEETFIIYNKLKYIDDVIVHCSGGGGKILVFAIKVGRYSYRHVGLGLPYLYFGIC